MLFLGQKFCLCACFEHEGSANRRLGARNCYNYYARSLERLKKWASFVRNSMYTTARDS